MLKNTGAFGGIPFVIRDHTTVLPHSGLPEVIGPSSSPLRNVMYQVARDFSSTCCGLSLRWCSFLICRQRHGAYSQRVSDEHS